MYTNILKRCSGVVLLLLLCYSSLFAQEKTIRGIVIDSSSGEGLSQAVVSVKGRPNNVITDADGGFSIKIAPADSILVFSYVGYNRQQIDIAGRQYLTVRMVSKDDNLSAVVVVGYGTQKEKDLTGAITTIQSKDILLNPSSNPLIALQGKVPGLDITKSSGAAGAGITMQLRGTRSLTARGNPLVLIDGMPGSYSTLNPNDIKNIEVLKDAASTAIYGSSGANGVILITTKQGPEGKTETNFNTYVGFNALSETPSVHNGQQYFNVKKQAQKEAGTYTTDDAVLSPQEYAAYQNGKYIDWVKAIIGKGLTQNYSLSFSGRTEKTSAYFSLNYNDDNGQYKGNNYKVLSSNLRIEHKLASWISAGVNSQLSYTISNNAYSKMENALRTMPYGQLYDSTGMLNVLPVAGDEQTVNYLLDVNKNVYRNSNSNFSLYFNPYIRITPFTGFTFETRVDGNLNYSTNNSFIGMGSYQYYFAEGASATGTTATVAASITPNRSYNYKWENILTYEFHITHKHQFKFTGVTTYDYNQADNAYLYNNQFSSNAYFWENLAAGKSPSVSSSYTMSKGLGLIGRLNYAYNDKYLFQASIREDGSSKLADGHQWASFPAVSAGWRITQEPFMRGVRSWLPNLKLRASYGVAGTASINPYSSVSNIESGFYSLSGIKVDKNNYSQLLANPDLTWERSHTSNIGLDAGFLNYRIKLSADYYITNTNGIIWTKNIPVVNGAYNASTLYQILVNIAKTRNTGIELALNTENIVSKNFTWSSSLTYSKNKEAITKLTGNSGTPVINGNYALQVGYPVNSFYNYKILGVWQKNEAAQAAVFGEVPGDLKIDVPNLVKVGENQYIKLSSNGSPVVDNNGNKIIYSADNPYAINANDEQIIGHNSPDWSLGFQNTFTYKSFDLTIYTYMRFGQMINYSLLSDYDPSASDNFPNYFNYWTSTNPSNDFPALNASKTRQDYLGFSALSDVDGSFFKIKNITLGYTLPKNVSDKLRINKLRIYGTATNLLIIAKSHLIKQYDPEQNGSLDFPLTKQIVIGANLTF